MNFDFLVELKGNVATAALAAAGAADAASASLEALTIASVAADEAGLALAMTLGDDAASAAVVSAAVLEATAANEALAVAQAEAAASAEAAAVAEGEEGLATALADMIDPATAAEVAVAAVAAAAVALGVALGAMAMEALDASEAHDKLLASLSALAGGAAGGQKALEAIRSLEETLPQSEAQLSSWAQALMAAGTTDMSKLKDQLTAISDAEALVAGGGEKVKGLLEKLQEEGAKGTRIRFSMAMLAGTGLTQEEFDKAIGMSPAAIQAAIKTGNLTGQQISDAITAALKAKGGAANEGLVNSLSSQWQKFKDNIAHMFEDVNIKPFIDGLKSVLHLFSQDTASGRAMKSVITAAFTEIFAVASKVFPYVKAAIIQIAIAALEMKISWDKASDSMKGLGGAGMGLKIVLMPFMGMLHFIERGFVNVSNAIVNTMAVVNRIKAVFSGAKSAAGDLISGLVSGIAGGAGRVWAAIKAMATGAIKTLEGVLGIHSPSRVMMALGGHTATGFAQGVSNDNAKAQSAMSKLGTPPKMAAGAGHGGSGGGKGVSIAAAAAAAGAAAGAAVAGGHAPEDVAKLVAHAVADFFERAADTQAA